MGKSLQVLYLHGFASSARSTKANYFASKLAAHGITLHTPDLNEPAFSTLTVSRMIDQVRAAIGVLPDGPVVLIGSSLGAFVAVQVALTSACGANPRIDRLVLLAPALAFDGNRAHEIGDRGLDAWRSTGALNVFHYGYGQVMPVRYELYSDACGYDCLNADLTLPIQIFQGTADTSVAPSSVEAWARSRPNVELHMLDDDHQLGRSLDYIWAEMSRFIGL